MSNKDRIIHAQELFNSFASIYSDLDDNMTYYKDTLEERKKDNSEADYAWYVARIDAYSEILKFIEKKLGI